MGDLLIDYDICRNEGTATCSLHVRPLDSMLTSRVLHC
jgi:hypothetical protein